MTADESGGKGGRGLKILGGLAAVFGLTLQCCGGFMGSIMGSLKQSGAYTSGLEMATSDPRVQEALGEPIEAGWIVSGSVSVNGGSGEAELSVPLQGSKGAGTLYLEADKSAGDWDFDVAKVDVNGSKIDLLDWPE